MQETYKKIGKCNCVMGVCDHNKIISHTNGNSDNEDKYIYILKKCFLLTYLDNLMNAETDAREE